MEQVKRGLCPYDDKRYLLADLPDGSPNPYTHAYGHKDLAAEEHFEAVMPEAPGTDLVVENRERRYIRKHAYVVKKLLALPGHRGDQEEQEETEEPGEIPGDVALSTGDWDKAAQVAAARPGVTGRIDDMLQRLFAAGRPVSTPPPQPPVFDAQRAGPSATNHPEDKAKRARIDSTDTDGSGDDIEPVRQVRSKRGRNPFILYEAADEENEGEDEKQEQEEEQEEKENDYSLDADSDTAFTDEC